MKDYQIFVDLSADVFIDVAKENNIGFVPMQYSLGEEFRTSKYIETDETLKLFYNSQRNGDLTKTTQVTPFAYEEFFTPYCEKGINILYFPLSSGLSKTYESALLAKNALEEKFPNIKIEVVDSLAATGGIGVIVDKAIKNKNSGMTLEENANVMKEYIKRIKHWLFVEDLKYLKRGGRVSAATAFIGTALKIKPIIKVNEVGKLDTIAKKHGSKQAALYIIDLFEQTRDENEKCVYIAHADNIEMANFIKDKLLSKYPDLEIYTIMLSPIIGAHTGPDMCAICHFGK